MRTTIDRSGRLVIPKELRERVGLAAGEVEIELDGADLRLRPVAGGQVVEVGGRLVIQGSGPLTDPIDDEVVAELRRADQR